jgi:hypothetical protein
MVFNNQAVKASDLDIDAEITSTFNSGSWNNRQRMYIAESVDFPQPLKAQITLRFGPFSR